jgi:hypothetical protein
MGLAHALHTMTAALRRAAKRREEEAFTCGDCERSDRCGLPPTADCYVKLAQLEKDPTGHMRQMKTRVEMLKAGYWV